MSSLFGGGAKPPPPAPLPAPLPPPPTLADPAVQTAGANALTGYRNAGAAATYLTQNGTDQKYNAVSVLGGAAKT